MGRALGLFALAFLILAVAPSFALALGTYTDYVYDKDYSPPSPPAQKTELTCDFFAVSNTSCSILGLASKASREQILFAIIRKNSPEENQDWVRYWNSRLRVGGYYEDAGDGESGENGSIRNAWFRLVDFYPSVFDPRDNYTYLPRQVYVNSKANINMVVKTAPQSACSQEYGILGYDFELRKHIKTLNSSGPILPVSSLLSEGEKANLTLTYSAMAGYNYRFGTMGETRVCDQFDVCEEKVACATNGSQTQIDTLEMQKVFGIKRYPDTFEYENTIRVPSRGYAQGMIKLRIPADFLYYEFRIKGASYRVQKNDLRFKSRGSVWPVLSLELIPSPSEQGNLQVVSNDATENGSYYSGSISYKMFVEQPDIADSDCTFTLATPFETKIFERACSSTVVEPQLDLNVYSDASGKSKITATVTDPLGNPIEGAEVEFSGGIPAETAATGSNGNATITVSRRESTYTVSGKVKGTGTISEAQKYAYVPGIGAGDGGNLNFPGIFGIAAPILLIIVVISALVALVMRTRNREWMSFALACLLVLSLVAPAHSANVTSTGGFKVQQALDACKNYDFDNAVRHLGECTEAYRLSSEFDSMRATVGTLISNIAPLVVANPDIKPYKGAYASMSALALSLFRVAWAFNSLYLILNIFNPVRRSAAIKQYIMLIVFVLFVYASYIIIEDSITLVNSLAVFIAGERSSTALMQTKMSVEFVSENYEMLKLILPFLNLTYLILLARYILVIGTLLFFPFTLLMYFTSATRGFGQAALTVTFATLGLGVLNAVLMLIYNILSTSSDPILSSSFSTTFFSASFLIFFGFVNVLMLAIAFLSGIVFIGQTKIDA